MPLTFPNKLFSILGEMLDKKFPLRKLSKTIHLRQYQVRLISTLNLDLGKLKL